MAKSNVYNATTSINKYFQNIYKPACEIAIGEPVCIYFEPNQFLTYPSIVVHQLVPGTWDYDAMENKNLFELHIFVKNNEQMKALKMIDAFFEVTGLTTDNVTSFQQISISNYSVVPPVPFACGRLIKKAGNGFTYVDDIDKEIRHYRIDLEFNYK